MQGALTEFAHEGTTNTEWATHSEVMNGQEAAAWITVRIGPRGGARHRLCRTCLPALPAGA
ncbi:hypothetical protein [Streptomyces dangxiongensis]|uniref:hypothetical protein n=1 Tax=Streptomyces dangxiongensis TaxID=1442032 RepID=UPI0013CE9C54|nr:hypothetical protein [Streptomyces dangxiongensis]